jgi:hypothetical protein
VLSDLHGEPARHSDDSGLLRADLDVAAVQLIYEAAKRRDVLTVGL